MKGDTGRRGQKDPLREALLSGVADVWIYDRVRSVAAVKASATKRRPTPLSLRRLAGSGDDLVVGGLEFSTTNNTILGGSFTSRLNQNLREDKGWAYGAYTFLQETPHPTEDQVREAISGNICRCTGYIPIMQAILQASRSMAAESSLPAG